MGLAASPSQALRGGSWAALFPIHFLKPFPDPASPESDLSAPPGLPGAGSTWPFQPLSLGSPSPRAPGRQEGRVLAHARGLVPHFPRGPSRHRGGSWHSTLGGAAPCSRLTHGLMAHGGALLASWPPHSVRGQCVPRLHFCFSRGHSTTLSWGAQGFSGIAAR